MTRAAATSPRITPTGAPWPRGGRCPSSHPQPRGVSPALRVHGCACRRRLVCMGPCAVCPAVPAGRGAQGLSRVSGPRVSWAVRPLLRRLVLSTSAPPRTMLRGRLARPSRFSRGPRDTFEVGGRPRAASPRAQGRRRHAAFRDLCEPKTVCPGGSSGRVSLKGLYRGGTFWRGRVNVFP